MPFLSVSNQDEVVCGRTGQLWNPSFLQNKCQLHLAKRLNDEPWQRVYSWTPSPAWAYPPGPLQGSSACPVMMVNSCLASVAPLPPKTSGGRPLGLGTQPRNHVGQQFGHHKEGCLKFRDKHAAPRSQQIASFRSSVNHKKKRNSIHLAASSGRAMFGSRAAT